MRQSLSSSEFAGGAWELVCVTGCKRAGDETMTEPRISIRFNGEVQEVSMGTTIAQLLEHAGIRSKLVAVEVNLEIVPHEEHTAHQVQAGDTIEVVTLVGGG